MIRFGLVSFFNGILTLFRLFNAKTILLEEQKWYYLTHSWEDKRAHTFPKGICPKVNVIARLEYELAYYDSAVQRFNHYTSRTPPWGMIRQNSQDSAIIKRYAFWSLSTIMASVFLSKFVDSLLMLFRSKM